MTGLPNYIFDDQAQYEGADLVAAEATDAAIADLTPIEACAIHHAYLAAVFRFRRSNFEHVLNQAEKHVQESLIRRGIFVPRVLEKRAVVQRIIDKAEKQA